MAIKAGHHTQIGSLRKLHSQISTETALSHAITTRFIHFQHYSRTVDDGQRLNHAFEYETTDDLLRRSNSQFLRTHFHWKAKLASVAYALIAVLLVVTDPGVLSGIMAGFGILLFGLVGFAFATRLRRARAFMRKLPHRRAKCTIDDTGLHLENAAGISHLEWRMVEKAVAGPHVWHFYISRNVPFAVPAAALADGAADFVTDKIQSAGGKIVRIA